MFKVRKDLKITPEFADIFEPRYRPLTESRRLALRQLKKPQQKLDPEENSDDDLYTRNTHLKEKTQYDINVYPIP